MNIQKLLSIALLIVVIGFGSGVALAHVSVAPSEVGVALKQDFTVTVPNEEKILTVSVRLVLPEGLGNVTPIVKQGWTIATKKEGEGEDAKVTEITWSGGKIPEGQKDQFTFTAQVPAKEGSILWKTYQTYEDGKVVSWDQEKEEHGSESDESETSGPAAKTSIVDDLKATKEASPMTVSYIALAAGLASLLLSAYSLQKKGK